MHNSRVSPPRTTRPCLRLLSVSIVAGAFATQSRACEYHWLINAPEGSGITVQTNYTSAADAAKSIADQLKAFENANADAALKSLGAAGTEKVPGSPQNLGPVTTPLDAIASWKINYTGAKAHSPNATINSFISNTTTDVTGVWFDANYVYIKTNGVASHDIGRADGNNPAYARASNQTLRITRNPVQNTGTLTAVGNGEVAVASNGVAYFDGGDAQTYNNAGTWHRIANVFEAATFDTGPGHSAPQGTPSNSTPGTYHYHVGPTALLDQIDITNNGTRHSPIIGFAPDGFPIYGPYGYSNPTDPNSPIKLITTSYQLRTDLTPGAPRNSLTTGGTLLTGSALGPNVNATVNGISYPAGSFKEDYNYVAGSGDLNIFNMRFAVTPEFPQGTMAYYMTTNAAGNFTYPYLLSPNYYGVVAQGALANTTIPGAATQLKAGDLNFDGLVNFSDLQTFAFNYGKHGVTLWSQGDFDSNIDINDADLALLQGNYATPATFAADWARAQAAVPEPTSITLMLALSSACALRRRRPTA